ncbi:MAG TPA: hypothetical protein VF062_17415 [Candidatus Limnocylindrales bacterium]
MSAKLSLFADCLLAGLLIAVSAIGVITAYPGFVAACSFPFSFRGYRERLRQVIESGPLGMFVPPLLVAVLVFDAAAIRAGVPGSFPLGMLLAAVAVGAAVLGLRAASRWRPGERWSAVARLAWRDLIADASGSLLLGMAVIAAAVIVVLVPVTLLLIGGMLALAAVGVGARSQEVTWQR